MRDRSAALIKEEIRRAFPDSYPLRLPPWASGVRALGGQALIRATSKQFEECIPHVLERLICESRASDDADLFFIMLASQDAFGSELFSAIDRGQSTAISSFLRSPTLWQRYPLEDNLIDKAAAIWSLRCGLPELPTWRPLSGLECQVRAEKLRELIQMMTGQWTNWAIHAREMVVLALLKEAALDLIDDLRYRCYEDAHAQPQVAPEAPDLEQALLHLRSAFPSNYSGPAAQLSDLHENSLLRSGSSGDFASAIPQLIGEAVTSAGQKDEIAVLVFFHMLDGHGSKNRTSQLATRLKQLHLGVSPSQAAALYEFLQLAIEYPVFELEHDILTSAADFWKGVSLARQHST